MQPHWLVRPRTIRLLWIAFVVVLAATVLAEGFVAHEGQFGYDGTFGFGAWFGFLACVGLIVFAKVLGLALKRPDEFYREDRDE